MKLSYHKNSTTSNDKGFTIIEVMVVIGIFAIGILAVASMQISAARANRSATLRTDAITRASERMENLVSQTYSSIAGGNETVDNYTISWTVSEDTLLPDTKEITVTVTWDDWQGIRTMTLNHIVAKLD